MSHFMGAVPSLDFMSNFWGAVQIGDLFLI